MENPTPDPGTESQHLQIQYGLTVKHLLNEIRDSPHRDLTQFHDPVAIGWGVTYTESESASPVLRQGCAHMSYTVETGYKVAICPGGERLYMQIYAITGQSLLFGITPYQLYHNFCHKNKGFI